MAINGTVFGTQYTNVNNSAGGIGGGSAKAPNAGTGWWVYPIIDNWGVATDPQGAYPKPDINILLPANFPIANILPGTVSGIHRGDVSYGGTVTIKLDTPLNPLATHIAWNHLIAIAPGLQVGQRVNPGDIVAYGGADQSLGSAPAAVGFILYPGDNYASDGAFSKYFKYGQMPDSRLYPKPVLDALNSGSLGDPSLYAALFAPGQGSSALFQSSNTGNANNFGEIVRNALPIDPNENVTQFLEHIDYALALIDPFPASDAVDKLSIGIGPASWQMPNPISWLGDTMHNIFIVDLPSLILRGVIVSVGVYICFQVVQQYIKIGPILNSAGQAASSLVEGV